MPEYIVFMHSDALDRAVADDGARWGAYLGRLRESGCLRGGSAIGPGQRLRKGLPPAPSGRELEGFIRLGAASLDDAMRWLEGNPNYEAGGTVEIRQLLEDE